MNSFGKQEILDYFQLKDDPFAITPNVSLYCGLPTHEEALRTLSYVIESNEGFFLAYGEVGVGKTLLCRKLLQELGKKTDIKTCYLPNPNISIKAIERAICDELEIDKDCMSDDEGEQCYHQISARLLELAQQNIKTVLIIDEAQTLSDAGLEYLRLLSNLETESKKLIQIIFFAQTEILEKLAQPNMRQLAQRMTYSCLLEPITKDKLRLYLTQRLLLCGHNHGQLFTDKATQKLWKASYGIPRLVNTIADKALLCAFSRHATEIDAKDVMRATSEMQLPLKAKTQYYMSDMNFRVLMICSGFVLGIALIVGIISFKGVLF